MLIAWGYSHEITLQKNQAISYLPSGYNISTIPTSNLIPSFNSDQTSELSDYVRIPYGFRHSKALRMEYFRLHTIHLLYLIQLISSNLSHPTYLIQLIFSNLSYLTHFI
jgi:hypothetical protein